MIRAWGGCHFVESLEQRRLFAGDLAFGSFALSGGVVFQPDNTTSLDVIIRNLTGGNPLANSITFKYVNVGFRADDEKASYDDPSPIPPLGPFTIPNVPLDAAGRSNPFELHPQSLPQGRYELLGRIDDGDGTQANDTRAFGAGWAMPTRESLTIPGTAGSDRITITPTTKDGVARYTVKVNDYAESFRASKIRGFTVQCGSGDDVVIVDGAIANVRVEGGDGNDRIAGGTGNDTLRGGAGADQIDGGAGNDRLDGNGGNDKLFGNDGADHLYGYAGNDYLDGGSSGDRLDGGAGVDTLLGQSGNDRFFARDLTPETLFGGGGDDEATVDASDILSSIQLAHTS